MSTEADSVEGTIELVNVPDTACYTSFANLLRDLQNYIQVRVPKSVTNVVVSNVQPLDTQRNSVWFRQSNGGVFMGIYLYSNGSWQQFFPVPRSIYRVSGDSRNPPEGFITTDDANFLTSDQKDFLRATWMPDPTAQFYIIYDVVPAPT